MPRDGLQQYHVPPGTNGITNYTIESTKYNAFTADVEQDLNLPRPIVAGGTGANNGPSALNNLGGELAAQVITNYNSDPFQAGSFSSAAGATSAPTANAFTGICYVSDAPTNANMFIEARDQTTTTLWVRQKKAGVWGNWLLPAGVASGATPPTGVSANTLWWDPNRGKLFIYYTDVDSSQWVEAVAVPDLSPNNYVRIIGETMTGPLVLPADPTTALQAATKQYVDAGDTATLTTKAVRYDTAQALTVAQQVQARQNIYAAPFDALAYNGMQINGSFEVSQERGAVGSVAPNNFVVDGWRAYWAGSMALTAAQGPSIAPGISNTLSYGVNTAQASMGAADTVIYYQNIEGYRIARLAWGTAAAQPITITFWSSNILPGIYSVVVRNTGGARSYAATYTQAAGGVAQYNIITIPGDTTGTWAKDNTIGMELDFCFACGSSQTAPAANTWYGAAYRAAPGQVNCVGSTSYGGNISGVIVLPGIEAPSAARSALIMRPFDQELWVCKRYLQVSDGWVVNGFNPNTTIVRTSAMFSPTMRAGPTLQVRNAAAIAINSATANVAPSSVVTGVSGINAAAASLDLNCTAVFGAGQGCIVSFSTGALLFDARI